MPELSKRATVYFEPHLHKVLRLKALETSQSFSELVNQTIKLALLEDAEDLRIFEERKHESLISFEAMLKQLKKDGRL